MTVLSHLASPDAGNSAMARRGNLEIDKLSGVHNGPDRNDKSLHDNAIFYAVSHDRLLVVSDVQISTVHEHTGNARTIDWADVCKFRKHSFRNATHGRLPTAICFVGGSMAPVLEVGKNIRGYES